jgi:DNA-binding response OmpR family regulator
VTSSKGKKILAAGTDLALSEQVGVALEERGYSLKKASSWREAVQKLLRYSPDLVLVEKAMLSKQLDGWETYRRIREVSDIPIIVITDGANEEDPLNCLRMGADDCLVQPLVPEELVARMEALLRRREWKEAKQKSHIAGNLFIHFARGEVSLGNRPVRLTSREFILLSLLVENAGEVLSHEQLLERIGPAFPRANSRALRYHIQRLREKLEKDPSSPQLIITHRGAGYSFALEAKADKPD